MLKFVCLILSIVVKYSSRKLYFVEIRFPKFNDLNFKLITK